MTSQNVDSLSHKLDLVSQNLFLLFPTFDSVSFPHNWIMLTYYELMYFYQSWLFILMWWYIGPFKSAVPQAAGCELSWQLDNKMWASSKGWFKKRSQCVCVCVRWREYCATWEGKEETAEEWQRNFTTSRPNCWREKRLISLPWRAKLSSLRMSRLSEVRPPGITPRWTSSTRGMPARGSWSWECPATSSAIRWGNEHCIHQVCSFINAQVDWGHDSLGFMCGFYFF